MGTYRCLGLVAGSVALVGSAAFPSWRAEARQAPAELRIQALESPAPAGSAQPQLTVSDRGVLLSWIERQGATATLRFSERTTAGWSPARTVASGSDWFVNWADVPSVMRLANGTLAAHWLQKSGPSTYAYDVRLSYSKDDGRTWAASFTPHHDGTKTEHGFASLVQMPRAGLGLVWLDGRSMMPGAHDAAAGAGHGGAMSVRAATYDTAWKQISETAVDLKVCECCPTTAAVTADGLIAAYRDVSDTGVRDIYVSRLENGKWTTPAAVHHDDWKINACPVNGPMLSARGRDVAIAWFTGKEDPGHAFVAFSKDAGRTFGTPIRVDDAGSIGRVDVELLPDGSAAVSWLEYVERRAEFRVRRIGSAGTKSPAVKVASLAAGRANGYPRIAWHADTLTLAWAESLPAQPGSTATSLRVMTATAR